MQTKRFAAALMLVGSLLLALGADGVSAGANGAGAQVLAFDECFPLGGGATACYAVKGMLHEVTTPSGAVSYVTNYRSRLQVFEGSQSVWDETANERIHTLTKDGALQEISSRSRFTVTVSGTTFCVAYHLHGTHGVDQFVRTDFC